MQVEKKVLGTLSKCYSMAELDYRGRPCFLVAAEKNDPCYLFSREGERLATVWEEPGGVMTMVQVPGSDGQFLATHKFYSPNDSKEAKIVIATPRGDGWEIRTLCAAPFVHRFGILERNGVHYLLACCLKSGHEYKEDWRSPGACYGAVLPEDLSSFDDSHPLALTKLKDGMLKNHGYCKIRQNGHDAAVVGCEEGTFLFAPPDAPDGEWEIRQLCAVPSSDSVLLDFDGDGQLELGCISPFHGASLTIYHLDECGNYVPRWKLDRPETDTEMLHATWAGTLLGKPTWVVGWRKGTRETIAITWRDGAYHTDTIDRDTGCANVMHLVDQEGRDTIVATNREIDEIAMYTITE